MQMKAKVRIFRSSVHQALGLFSVTLLTVGCSANGSVEQIVESDNVVPAPNGVLDLSQFEADALTSSEIVDCELSDGTETQCYLLRTSGLQKVSDNIGPFCPSTTSTTAEDSGIWLDGQSLYEADGDFFLNLPNIYGDDYPSTAWAEFADAQGTINVTQTLEDCQAAANPNVGPEYAGFCVQCDLAELTADLELEFLIPVTPINADQPQSLSASAGISLNGFQIAAQAPVDAILSAVTVAPFDDCGGHVNPNDGYHYHAATAREGCNSAGIDENGHPELMGYAMDGYGIYGPLPAGSAEAGSLDECNGSDDAELGYHYHAGSPELNQHIACFKGKVVASSAGPGGPRGPRRERGGDEG